MARGNQREKAREKNMKTQAGKKPKTEKSGPEMARDKEAAATLMKEKQAAADARKAEMLKIEIESKREAKSKPKPTKENESVKPVPNAEKAEKVEASPQGAGPKDVEKKNEQEVEDKEE